MSPRHRRNETVVTMPDLRTTAGSPKVVAVVEPEASREARAIVLQCCGCGRDGILVPLSALTGEHRVFRCTFCENLEMLRWADGTIEAVKRSQGVPV